MSSDYFFSKWKNTLTVLNAILEVDRFLQEAKAHDKTLCEASERLSGMLAQYIKVFNDALDCKIHNAQVQKIPCLEKVVVAISQRILELKQELRKLHCSNFHFLSNGLKAYKLTPYDVEFIGVPEDAPRPKSMDAKLLEIFKAVKEEKERLELEQQKEDEIKPETKVKYWWDSDDEDTLEEEEEKEKLTEEQLKTQEMAALIQSHERSRQVTFNYIKQKMRRERWIKNLGGTVPPPARLDLKMRAAKLIQMTCRIYFEQKRKKIEYCKRDQLLGIQYCGPPKLGEMISSQSHELKIRRIGMRKKYSEISQISYDNMRQNYVKNKIGELKEYYRDLVRDWFYTWFQEIRYFHDIPKEKEGGVVAIIKDETPSPTTWLEECKKAIEQQEEKKGKTAQELKFAAQEAKHAKMLLKKEEQLKAKQQANLIKKLLKSPALHPGYYYPKSQKILNIVEAVEEYHKHWDKLDDTEMKNVKERFVSELHFADACAEARIEVTEHVTDDMNKELKLLKTALKADYTSIGEEMLQPIQKKAKKGKKKRKPRAALSEHIAEQLQTLAMMDIFKEYPRTTLEDFLGDHNLIGDDVRCNYGQALPYPGETRSLWWERCREVIHGHRKVLIVGPEGSGRTKLVHAMASLNDATLFEIDPCEIPNAQMSADNLKKLVTSLTKCAQVTQPAIICLKNIHRLYYSQAPPELADVNTTLLQTYFVQKLCKRLNKNDNVTLLGTCEDPWLTKPQLLKHFPIVVPLPNTAYSTVFKLLYDWVTNDHSIPNDLDIQGLSRVLQGYSYGYIKERLQKFLTPEKIIHIGAHGLKPQDIYNFFLEDDTEKVEYDKYWKWYFDKTTWGRKEKQHYADQQEYKAALEKYEEKQRKKAKIKSAASSKTSMKP